MRKIPDYEMKNYVDPISVLKKSSHPSLPLAHHSALNLLVPSSGDGSGGVFVARRGSTTLSSLGLLGDKDGAALALKQEMNRPCVNSVIVSQTREEDLGTLSSMGFCSEIFGRSYSICLPDFTDKGKPLAKVRQNVNRARRDGVEVHEIEPGFRLTKIIKDITEQWIKEKGFHTKKLNILVGEDQPSEAKETRTFVAFRDGRPVGFVMYSSAYAGSDSWLYDLTRRTRDAPPGTIEIINLTAVKTLAHEGNTWLHLGLTPFIGLGSGAVLRESRRLTLLLTAISKHGKMLYPAVSQERFKLKWNPHRIETEYISVWPKLSLAALYQMMRMVNMI